MLGSKYQRVSRESKPLIRSTTVLLSRRLLGEKYPLFLQSEPVSSAFVSSISSAAHLWLVSHQSTQTARPCCSSWIRSIDREFEKQQQQHMSEFNGKGNFNRGHHGKGGGRQQHGKGKGKGQHNGKDRKAGVNGRGGGNRRRQDINAQNFGDRNRANRDAGSGGGQGAGHRGARAESSPWEPDQGRQLQRRDIVLSASEQYTLFFPLELTNKDYLRRIFETVAQGIKDRTVQISEDNQLRRFYENDFDGTVAMTCTIL